MGLFNTDMEQHLETFSCTCLIYGLNRSIFSDTGRCCTAYIGILLFFFVGNRSSYFKGQKRRFQAQYR